MILNPVFLVTFGAFVGPRLAGRARDLAPTCALLALICGLHLRSQVWAYQRSGSLGEQTHPGEGIPHLGGVRIREDLGATMRRLRAALKERDVTQGVILGYPDIPGYVAVSGLRAFGTAWYFTGYPNIDAVNCAYLSLGAESGDGPVYLLKGAEFSPLIRTCFESRLEPDQGRFFEEGLGGFWDYRSGSFRDLELSGPYLGRRESGQNRSWEPARSGEKRETTSKAASTYRKGNAKSR